jgi:hypothetical protein
VEELKFDAKSKVRDCIYFESSSGRGLATVNRGQWYNMMLFMHVMQRGRKEGGSLAETAPIKQEEEGKIFV